MARFRDATDAQPAFGPRFWRSRGGPVLLLAAASACSVELSGAGPAISPLDAGSEPSAPDAGAQSVPHELTDAAVGEEDAQLPSSRPDAGVPGCSLEGRFALRIVFDVDWVGTDLLSIVPIISPGSGMLSFVVTMDVASTASGLSTSLRTCSASVPEFVSTLPQEHYAARFDNAVWLSPQMPTFSSVLRSTCADPGCRVESDPVVALLGASLPDPKGPWPSRVSSGEWPDHDGDGQAGIAAYMLGPSDNPGGYDYPPLDFLATRRVRDLQLGLRVVVGVSGKLDSCDELSGETLAGRIDTRAVGCKATTRPLVCTTSELAFLDDNLPIWTVRQGRFQAKRVAPGADCREVRRVFESPP